MMNIFKTAALSLGLACAGSSAFAATVASLTFDGNSPLIVGLSQTVVQADGNYSASVDGTFDTSEVTDFLLEADFSLEGVSFLDEELLIEDVSLNDLLFGVGFLLQSIDPNLLESFGFLIAEALDTDGAQTEIFDNIFLSLDLTENSSSTFSSAGTFDFLLSDGPLDPFSVGVFVENLSFAGSFSISTVDVAAVPLPASFPMLVFGAFGLFAMKRRRSTN
ncbi:MAG: VPLPA-CTERM sorting domain-containing protein [Paracoccaceae bacterium]